MMDCRGALKLAFIAAVLLLSSGAFAPLWTTAATQDAAIEGELPLQILWAVVYGTVALLLLPRWKSVGALMLENKALLLLVLLCFVSAAWSADPAITLRKSVALLGTVLLGVLLGLQFEISTQLRILTTVLAIAALASLLAAMCAPQAFPPTEAAPGAWNGVFSHKNLLGRSMSLGAIAFLTLDRTTVARWLYSVGGAVLCLSVLVGSRSQTGLVVLLALSCVAGCSRVLRWESRQLTGSLLIMCVVAMPLALLASEHMGDMASLLHRDITLTGRSRIWTFAVLSFSQRPWIGYGYGAFWRVATESRQALALIQYQTPHAHNGFLDLGLQLGMTGVALFAAGWVVAFYFAGRLARHEATRAARWPLLYLVFMVLYSITENSLLVPNSILWILFAAACASASPSSRQLERAV